MAIIVRLAKENLDRISLKSLVTVTHLVAIVMMAVERVNGSMVMEVVTTGNDDSFEW